ncbi:MAG: RNase P subunit p30 family protein [Candidatus Thorarchaeota archaeon]
MSFDLGVLPTDVAEIDLFGDMARKLGLKGFAIVGLQSEPIKTVAEDLQLYNRIILHGKSINSVRKQIDKVRRKALIVSVPLRSIEVTNWAAEDKRVDLLTVDSTQDIRLRDTTAHLASLAKTCLEVQIAPLLKSSGLARSKILKSYRESVSTAMDAGMDVVLTSGAIHPIGLRSSVAMAHVGILLGMDRSYADRAVGSIPMSIIEENTRKLQPGFVSSGVEILQKGDEK